MAYPQISVIIPVYNTSEYLTQCLDTVVNQTFRDIEIICVNDSSTDGSLSILEEFSSRDDRLIIVNRESASGSAAIPRNTGIDLARGKYVMFLDSDDYFDLTMLEKLHCRAEEVKADLVMCGSFTVLSISGEIGAKDSVLHDKYLPESDVFSYMDIPDAIFQISSTSVWHKLILRETVVRHNLRFQLNTPSFDDIYFVNLILVLSERISVIRDRLVYYRLNRRGSQTERIGKHKDSIFLAISELNKYLAERSLYETVKTSLQKWTLTTMRWWLQSISDYDTYYELHDLYRHDYFKRLGLMDIDTSTLYDDLAHFYNSVLRRDIEPSLIIVLESILTPGSRIAIYGAGNVGNNSYEIIRTHGKHEVVIWCDKNADKLAGKLRNPLIRHPRDLKSCHADAVIIAIADRDIVNEVREYLTEMGIDSEKIYSV